MWSRYLNGKVVHSADYDALVELATICSMCNDSSVDYNEVYDINDDVPFCSTTRWRAAVTSNAL